MANKTSFKTHEAWLKYQRDYRNRNRSRIREINKKWRVHQSYNWNKKNTIAAAAHALTNRAIKTGILKRQPCEVCGTPKLNRAHHEDYLKPLEVRWFCEKHHRELHNV